MWVAAPALVGAILDQSARPLTEQRAKRALTRRLPV